MKKSKPLSANALADKRVQAAVDKAVVEALRPVLAENRDRLLRELQPHHITQMSVAAITEFLSQRRLLAVEEELNDKLDDLYQA